MIRFLDSNVFIYAFYKPGRHLTQLEKAMKDSSKKVISSMMDGNESLVTTVVHVSEVANILKHSLHVSQVAEMIDGVFSLETVEVLGVTKNEYLAASEVGKEMEMDPNDALAFQVMSSRGLSEIYSYDRVFERIAGIKRLPA